MARTRTLTNLLSDLRFLSDTQGLTARHDDTNLTRLLNQSIQRLRERVSVEGIAHYLTSIAAPAMPVGPTAPYQFGVIDLTGISPGVVRVYGVDVKVDLRWHSLDGIEFTRRNEYQDNVGVRNGIPIAFSNFNTAKIAIFPPSDGVYQYNAWYLPLLPDLAAPSDPFDGVAGWEDWVIWDCFVKLVNRDQYPQVYAMAVAEREQLWTDIVKGSSRVNRAAFVQRRDTWAESVNKRDYSRSRGFWGL